MVKQKIPEAINRLFNRVFICMKCNAKIRADQQKVMQGKVKCRKCGYKGLRPKNKELRR
jgi:large subunit ribosomal protein L40e